jgi:hypothetical protein
MASWDLAPGDPIKRTTLHQKYGGRRQGGIAPSRKSPNILIFTGQAGHRYGYFDAWHGGENRFHYTGEGQKGDQRLIQGNLSVLEHAKHGKAIRLFRGVRGTVSYAGEFKVDPSVSHYTTDAPDVTKEIRKVIVFRLIPVGLIKSDGLPPPQEPLKPEGSKPECAIVEAEKTDKEQFTRGAVAEGTAERREADLIKAYRAFRQQQNLKPLKRLKIKPPGETQWLYSDLFDEDQNRVIEAKGTVTREAIRMAIGQLFDYHRFRDGCQLAVLVPERPRKDLRDLLAKYHIAMIVRSGLAFSEIEA